MNGDPLCKMEILGVNAFANEIPIDGLPQQLSSNMVTVEAATTQIGSSSSSSVNLNNLSSVPIVDTSLSQAGKRPSNGDPKRKWHLLGKRQKLSRGESLIRREQHYKQIVPKTALQLIPEYYNREEIFDREILRSDPMQPFEHELLLNGLQFIGQGRSKKAAKFNAYDQAFKKLFIEPNKETIMNFLTNKNGVASTSALTDQPDETTNGTNGTGTDLTNIHMNGRYPALLSFAMHEYFTNYFAQDDTKMMESETGFDSKNLSIPALKQAPTCIKSQPVPIKQTARAAKKLPDNAHLMNPSALVNIMRPDAKFIEMDRDDNGNFVMKLELDGKTFISAATNKKNSKHQCSQLACESLFNIVYPLNSMF